MKKRTKHGYSTITTRTRRNRSAQTLNRYICFVKSNRRNRSNRSIKIKCNARRTNSKEEENIKSLALSPLKKGSISKSG